MSDSNGNTLAVEVRPRTVYDAMGEEDAAYMRGLAKKGVRAIRAGVKEMMILGEVVAAAYDRVEAKGHFAAWCQEELGIGRTRAYKYRESYLAFKGRELPDNLTAQALYALAGPEVPDEARQEVFARAEAEPERRLGKKEVEAAIESAGGRAKKAPPKAPSIDEAPRDNLGRKIPRELRDVFADGTAMRAACEIEALKPDRWMGALADRKANYPFLKYADLAKALQAAIDKAERAAYLAAEGAPYCVCPECKGKAAKGEEACDLCMSSGYLTLAAHRALPA
jgi:hypothetical protein